MKKKIAIVIFSFLIVCLLLFCFAVWYLPKIERFQKSGNSKEGETIPLSETEEKIDSQPTLREKITLDFGGIIPKEWGERVTGVKTRLDTTDKVMALTFDACGGENGNAYDKSLIEYLEENKIPATLFLNARWIDANLKTFKELSENPLFLIANHGMEHRPCSVNGKSAYGENGTASPLEVFDEIEENAVGIKLLTGQKPKYFRSGTAYYDEVCVEIANKFGYEVVGFNTLGDGGAKFSKDQIKKALANASFGSIIILHMNHPESNVLKGLKEAIPELKKQGFDFVKLSQYGLK
jgi:peptidoglycan/xylan/chitin deacetylase (PgdA/CDA1 family)